MSNEIKFTEMDKELDELLKDCGVAYNPNMSQDEINKELDNMMSDLGVTCDLNMTHDEMDLILDSLLEIGRAHV